MPFGPVALGTVLLGGLAAAGAAGAAGGLACHAAAGARTVGAPARRAVYAPGWPAAHADASNSDYAPVQGARHLVLAWQRDFPGGSINLGATSDAHGRVYVTTNARGCHLYALDQATGRTIWCSAAVNRSAISSSALLDNQGRVFLSDNEKMVAFDAASGRILWHTPILGFTLSAQFTPSGHLLFITHIGRVYVLRRDTGQPVLAPLDLTPGAAYDPRGPQPIRGCMRGTEECPAANTIAVDQRTGRFYFTYFAPGARQAGLRAMQYQENPPSLTPLWANDTLPGGSGSSPDLSADGTRLYVNDNRQSIHAIAAATGETVWSVPIGWASGGSPATSPEGLIIPTGGPLMGILDRGGRGEVVWRAEAVNNRGIAAQAAGCLAYPTAARGDGKNDLLVIDTKTGAELDRVALPGTTLFTVGTTIGRDRTVYVATIRGQLFALRPAGTKAN